MIYINKNIGFWEIEESLPESYFVGTTKGEYLEGAYVPLNEEQVAFYRTNPNATPLEVWFMKLNVPEIYEPTEAEILVSAKIAKSQEIEDYDQSNEVNEFTFEGTIGWIDAPTRSNYRNSLEAATILEETSIVFELSNVFFTVELEIAKRLLARIQRYADACTIAARTHLAKIESLTNVDEVNNYDYTVDYPDKLILTMITV